MTTVAGLDVGGAHLKVALAEGARLRAVAQFVCPLWQGLDKLEAALAAAEPLLARAERAAVTMTGELSDLFASRSEGVATIVHRIEQRFAGRARYWAGPRGFTDAEAARDVPHLVGSTNFLATACLVQKRLGAALLIDFGSTTADIIPVMDVLLVNGLRGMTDAERQATGELVYTGLTRTAVMGVADRAPYAGQWVSLAREYLATMADVRRVLGDDLDEVDLHATADGKGKSRVESLRRLARMLGRDFTPGDRGDAASERLLMMAAAHIRERQRASLVEGAMQVLSWAPVPPDAPVVAAGVGAGEVFEIARRLGRSCVTFGDVAGCEGGLARDATWSAPAAAVALLADPDASEPADA